MKGRIIIFSTNYFPNVGGAEVAVKEITDRLDGYTFELITTRLSRDVPAQEQMGNVMIHRIGPGIGGAYLNKLLSPFLGVIKVFQLQRENKIDAFWAVMVTFTSGAPYIFNLLKFWNSIPIILTLQEGDSEAHLTKRHGGLTHLSWKLALRRAAFLTAISTYLKKRALRLGYSGPLEVIPNGVDVERFGSPATFEDMDALREKLGLTKDKRIVITVSRLVEKNGVDLIIKALQHLPEHVVFISAGDGPDREKLMRLVRKLKLENRVQLLPHIDHQELPVYLQLADVFVRPSRSEGMGNVFIEAMMTKTPVIGTAVGGIPDFLTDNETGFVCKKEKLKSIAEKVSLALDDQSLRNEVVEHAYKLVKERYDWSLIAKDMKTKVFDKLTK